MADGFTIKVEGLKELDRRLKELGPKVASKALRSAVSAGAQVIRKDAQVRVAKDTGRLKKAIFISRSRSASTQTKQTYIVGVRSGRKEQKKDRDAYYWRFIEFGHKPRKPKSPAYIARLQREGRSLEMGTQFVAARPFLVPAFESKKQEAFEKFRQKLRENIKKFAPLK